MSINRLSLPLLTVLSIFCRHSMAAFPVTIPDAIALNTNAVGDAGGDTLPGLATDGHGHWVAVWQSGDTLGGTIGNDSDILFARTEDNGNSWTPPEPLNTRAFCALL